MVQDGIDVMEDVPFGDGGIAVVRAELFKRPVGDVLAAVGAVLVLPYLEPSFALMGMNSTDHGTWFALIEFK